MSTTLATRRGMADRLPVAVLHAQLVRQWLETTTDQMQAVEPRERYWESTLRYAMTGAGRKRAGRRVCGGEQRVAGSAG